MTLNDLMLRWFAVVDLEHAQDRLLRCKMYDLAAKVSAIKTELDNTHITPTEPTPPTEKAP